MKKYYCIDCGKKCDKRAKRCEKCNKKYQVGKNSSNFIDGRTKRKHFCKLCGKIITYQSAYFKRKLCKSCAMKGKNNPCYRKKMSRKTKQKIRLAIDKHHIDLNKNNNNKNNILLLPKRKHIKLHYQGYRYLVETKQIKKYIKWFDKKYGLNEKRNKEINQKNTTSKR